MKKNNVLRSFALNFKLVGWLPILLNILVISIFFIGFHLGRETDLTYTRRMLEVVFPLIFGLHVAFILAPESEPSMELLLCCPESADVIFVKRLFVVGASQGAVALMGTMAFSTFARAESFPIALLRWFSCAILLGGIAALTTQITRQAPFGALMVTFFWCSSLYGADSILRRFPGFWPLHIYLQPDKVTLLIYLLNRLSLIFIGSILILLTRVLLRKEERVMGLG